MKSGSAMLHKALRGETSSTLIDQAMVSAGNFLTALVLARTLAPANYGTFSLFFLALFAINTCHSSLVVYPLTLRGAGSTADELSGLTALALIQTLLLATPLAMCIAIFAFTLHRLDLLLPLALAMLAWQLQETARRALLSALRARDAILPDALCYLGQGALLFLLRPHSLAFVFYLIAGTSLIATIWQAILVRVHLRGNFRSRSVEYGRYSWQMGRYILAGNALNMFSIQIPSWALAFAFGPLDVAGYQSLLNLVGVANPIIFSANNLLIPAIVRAAPRGIGAARRTALRYGARYGLLLVPCFLALLVAPHFIMHLAYGGHTSYAHLAPLLRPFVLAFAVQYVATIIGAYEGGMSRPQTYMWVQIASILALIGLGVPLILHWGIPGAIYAMLAASSVRLCAFVLIAWLSDKRIQQAAIPDRRSTQTSLPNEVSAAAGTALDIRVCVLTYRRPELLRLTLKSLLAQTVVGSASIRMSIVVIDNDARSSAAHIVTELRVTCPVPLSYVANPRNGLSTGRNLGLDHAATCSFVAFIDDDETAQSDWLENLARAATLFSADVVTGPVLPQHLQSPVWVKRGGFFDPVLRPSGEIVPHVATNNTLLRANVVSALRFDPQFDSTGGEDTDFFLRAAQSGFQMVWCAEAKVTEWVPKERANLRWILGRAYSDANRFTRSSIRLDASPKVAILRITKGVGGIFVGVTLLAAGIFGSHLSARGLQLLARAAGTFAGLRGRSHAYYGTEGIDYVAK
jgi:succinoglycan biosynthesis protein ExoM